MSVRPRPSLAATLATAATVLLTTLVASAFPARGGVAEPLVADIVPVPLVDARGGVVDFAAGAVGDAVVVVNPIWTGCSSLCPLTSAVMGDLAERLEGRLGRDVRLLSLAIDPIEVPRDQLAGWVDLYGEIPGWLWLGGRPEAVEAVMAGLRAPLYGPVDAHPPVFLVVDGRNGRLRRLDGMADAGLLQAEIDRMRDGGR